MKDLVIVDEDYKKYQIKPSSKLAVILLFSEWDENSKNELKIVNEVYNEYLDLLDVYCIANINDEKEIERTKKLFKDNKYDFNLYFDLKKVIKENYNIIAVPTIIILDKTLNTVDKVVGDIDKEELIQRIDKYLNKH